MYYLHTSTGNLRLFNAGSLYPSTTRHFQHCLCYLSSSNINFTIGQIMNSLNMNPQKDKGKRRNRNRMETKQTHWNDVKCELPWMASHKSNNIYRTQYRVRHEIRCYEKWNIKCHDKSVFLFYLYGSASCVLDLFPFTSITRTEIICFSLVTNPSHMCAPELKRTVKRFRN